MRHDRGQRAVTVEDALTREEPVSDARKAIMYNTLRATERNGARPSVQGPGEKGKLHSLTRCLKGWSAPSFRKQCRKRTRRVQAWKGVRDAADHGEFSEYDDKIVKEMLSGVKDFLREHLEKTA